MPRLKMNDDEVLQYSEACKDECKDETSHIRAVWDQLLNQYMCQKDWKNKKKWQCNLTIQWKMDFIQCFK